eukprot:2484004-Pyramimonas_sp.AAC.1
MSEKCDVRRPWNIMDGLYSLCEALLPPPGSHVCSTSAHLIIPPTSVKNPEACRVWGGGPIPEDGPWELEGSGEAAKASEADSIGSCEAYTADPIENDNYKRVSTDMQRARNEPVEAVTRAGFQTWRLHPLMAKMGLKMAPS